MSLVYFVIKQLLLFIFSMSIRLTLHQAYHYMLFPTNSRNWYTFLLWSILWEGLCFPRKIKEIGQTPCYSIPVKSKAFFRWNMLLLLISTFLYWQWDEHKLFSGKLALALCSCLLDRKAAAGVEEVVHKLTTCKLCNFFSVESQTK